MKDENKGKREKIEVGVKHGESKWRRRKMEDRKEKSIKCLVREAQKFCLCNLTKALQEWSGA